MPTSGARSGLLASKLAQFCDHLGGTAPSLSFDRQSRILEAENPAGSARDASAAMVFPVESTCADGHPFFENARNLGSWQAGHLPRNHRRPPKPQVSHLSTRGLHAVTADEARQRDRCDS